MKKPAFILSEILRSLVATLLLPAFILLMFIFPLSYFLDIKTELSRSGSIGYIIISFLFVILWIFASTRLPWKIAFYMLPKSLKLRKFISFIIIICTALFIVSSRSETLSTPPVFFEIYRLMFIFVMVSAYLYRQKKYKKLAKIEIAAKINNPETGCS